MSWVVLVVTGGTNLWNDNVSQILSVGIELFGLVELQGVVVVKEVVLDAVVDVRDLGDVEDAVFVQEIFFEFGPSPDHQFPSFSVIEF